MTPEERRRRKVRRQTRRYIANHPPVTRVRDPLHNAVVYLTSLRCDDAQVRQDVLPK